MTGASMRTGPTLMGLTKLMGRRGFTGAPFEEQGARPMTNAHVTALIVAAGSGQRLGGGVPKQYRLLGGKPVLRWAVDAFASHPMVDAVRVVIGAGHEEFAR